VRSVVVAQLGREEQQEQDHGPAGIITTTTTVTTTNNNNSLARTVGTSGPAEAASRKRERGRLRNTTSVESSGVRLPSSAVVCRVRSQ